MAGRFDQSRFDSLRTEQDKADYLSSLDSDQKEAILQYLSEQQASQSGVPSPTQRLTEIALEKGKDYAINKGIKYGGDKIGEYLSSSKANIASQATADGAVASEAGAGLGSTALSVLGAGAGAYGLYNLGQKWGSGDRSLKGVGLGTLQGAASGAAIGSAVPGIGTLVGGAAGGLFGAASSLIKSGKHKDQKQRDAVRSYLQQQGMIDKDYKLKASDGSEFDIGKDGKTKNYNINWEDNRTGQTVGWANPLAEIISGGNDKIRTDFAGYLTNAANQGGADLETSRKRMLDYFKSMNLSNDQAVETLKGIKDKGGMTQDEFNAAVYGLGTLTSGKYDKDAAMNQYQASKNPVNQVINGGSLQQVPIPSKPAINASPQYIQKPANITLLRKESL